MNWIDPVRHDISSIKSSNKDLKKFGITIGIIFILFSTTAEWKQWWSIEFVIAIGVCGLILLFVGIVFPNFLKQIHHYWMCIAIIAGSLVSRIILCIIFFIILTPVAIVAKVFGKQFLHGLKKDKSDRLWIIRDQSKPINYEKMS